MPTSTLSGSWSAYKNSQHGPWFVSGTAYILTVSTNTVTMHRSTNMTSWTAVNLTLSGVVSADGATDGTNIHVVTMTGAAAARYTYTTSTNAWSLTASTASVVGISGVVQASVAPYSTGSAMLYQSATSAISMISYRRVSVIAQGVAATVLTANDAVNYDAYAAIDGAGGRVHLFYTGLGGTTRTLRHRTLTSAGTLVAEQTIDTIENSNYPVGLPAFDGTNIIIPYKDASGSLVEARAASADSPTWTTGTAITGDTVTDTGAIAATGTTANALWVTGGTSIKRASRTVSTYGSATTVVSGSATAILAQTQDTFGVGSSTVIYSQSFTPSAAWSVNGGTAKMNRAAGATGSYVMEIATAANTAGTVLASSDPMDVAALPTTAADISFSFGTSVSLSSGVTYFLRRRIISTSANISWRYSNNNPYAGGSRFTGPDAVTTDDFVFSLLTTPFTTATHTANGSNLYTLYDDNGTVTLDYPTTGGSTTLTASGTSSGTSTVAGAAKLALAASASSAGTSSVAGTATQGQTLLASGTSAGTSTVTGNATQGQTLLASATSAGTSTVSGAIVATATLAATSAGTSTVTANTTIATRLFASGTSAGAGTVAGSARMAATASGAATGTSTVTGDATTGATLTASGTSAGTSTVTGAAKASATASASSAGVATVTGATTLAAKLAGTSAGTSTVSGNATTGQVLSASGTSAGTSTVTGAAKLAVKVSATSAGTSTVTGNTSQAGVLYASATSAGTSSAAATANIRLGTSATSAGSASVSAQARIGLLVSATATGGSVVDEAITRLAIVVDGTAAGIATVAGYTTQVGGLPAARLAGIRWIVHPEPVQAIITAGVEPIAASMTVGTEPIAASITPGNDGLAMALTANDLEGNP